MQLQCRCIKNPNLWFYPSICLSLSLYSHRVLLYRPKQEGNSNVSINFLSDKSIRKFMTILFSLRQGRYMHVQNYEDRLTK